MVTCGQARVIITLTFPLANGSQVFVQTLIFGHVQYSSNLHSVSYHVTIFFPYKYRSVLSFFQSCHLECC